MTDTPDNAAAAWPIAAAMLQFPGTLRDGTAITDAGPDHWRRLLRRVVLAGFDNVEIPSAWLRLGDLSATALGDFGAVVSELGLGVPGITVVRESIIHPAQGSQNLAFSHRTIDAAAELGVPVVCLGLHDALAPAQRDVLWFWTQAPPPKPSEPETYDLAVRGYRELAEHAANVGVELSLELYEDTYLGTASDAVRFVTDIGHPAVGLNPDLGNLVRRQGPVEDWRDILPAVVPYTNYWHVKNYLRMEHENGTVFTAPATMATGVINYRDAVTMALDAGYRGAFVVEHYGGDGLGVGAMSRDYLRGLLSEELALR
ncbi:sugar phosphate isomerase/epimerase family protein [Humibacter albus]|uniref:sugar phosphate isomerase/epimerase family protein n=1 Tax=Humibacter albus TaxID=427754 RepID=UPI0003B5EF0F|nr:sugar phosphate isomerase/epimerase family protein [Humibacter albus]